MGACFEALTEGVLMAALDSRYTQVCFNVIVVQVCDINVAQSVIFEFDTPFYLLSSLRVILTMKTRVLD